MADTGKPVITVEQELNTFINEGLITKVFFYNKKTKEEKASGLTGTGERMASIQAYGNYPTPIQVFMLLTNLKKNLKMEQKSEEEIQTALKGKILKEIRAISVA